jgi:hypothetical protein
MIFDRIVHRTDTKPVTQDQNGPFKKEDKNFGKQYAKDDELFDRSSTLRSMTIKVKTMKTLDLDMQGDTAQGFLEAVEEGADVTDTSRSKITFSQKSKWLLHLFLILLFHIYIFYYVPLVSSYKMYNQPNCNNKMKKYYGCMNFGSNVMLMIIYALVCLYLWISARQISNGFPIYRTASSLMQNEDELAGPLLGIVGAIPFFLELRLSVDWVSSKTALDVNQFAQAFNFHMELFSAMVGNSYYSTKRLGMQIECQERIMCGCFCLTTIMLFFFGPIVIFSRNSPFVQENPVISGSVALNILINKTVLI